MAKGWGVCNSRGQVMVNTVSDTRRAAIVNYLVVEHAVLLTRFHTDQEIENLWKHYGKYVDVREVSITALAPQNSLDETERRT